MEDFKKHIEINITKEEANERLESCGTGYTTACDYAQMDFENEFIFGTDEFREKYKNGYEIKINII